MVKTLLLDANLAVLFVVGMTNPLYIRKHKRLAAYDTLDFKIVCDLIANSAGLLFAPNVLSETSNLARQIGEPIRSEISTVFANIIRRTDEQYVRGPHAVAYPDYVRLGLTDAVLLSLLDSNVSLLTAEFDLYLAASRAGRSVTNYNHIRALRLDYR